MVRWSIFVFLMSVLIPIAQAAQSGSGGAGGTNFACDTTTCICNGSYTDCKNMEEKCSGKISCPSGGTYCSCTKKLSVRENRLPRSNVIPDGAVRVSPK